MKVTLLYRDREWGRDKSYFDKEEICKDLNLNLLFKSAASRRDEEEGKNVLTGDEEKADIVITSFDTTLTYEKLTVACDFIRYGKPYIATHPDFNCPTETGFAPDIGAIIAFIEASAGRRPDLILGKPYGGIVEDALAITGLCKNQLAMVGDRLYTDIATGVNFGMLSVLVLTGESTRQEAEEGPVKPGLIFDRLSAMNPYL